MTGPTKLRLTGGAVHGDRNKFQVQTPRGSQGPTGSGKAMGMAWWEKDSTRTIMGLVQLVKKRV